MKRVLLTDFGSTYTKLTLVDLDTEEVISTSQSTTTVATNILDGYRAAFADLGETGEISEKLACSSAAGGLVVAAIGLVKQLTVEAAKRAALGAGAKVEYSYANFITQDEIEEIKTSGELVSFEKSSEDVTNAYSTFEIRYAALQARHARILELIEVAVDLDVILMLEEERYEIEVELNHRHAKHMAELQAMVSRMNED